ncbi:MAG: guanylate kinase [Firmicutes bacterium]|nr:guanylate kinase [Bacillota bacterium]
MGKGLLYVISGPSGAGKGTICKRVLDELDIDLSISMTTRKPREGEVHGVNYYFVTREEFQERIAEDGFFEYAQVYENYYGTPKQMVMEQLAKGRDVLLEIDTQGALNVKKAYPEGVAIFLLPPSLEELRKRLTGRGTETPEAIELRLSKTLNEISCMTEYDYCVVNDDLEVAVDRVVSIMKAEHSKVSRGVHDLMKRYEEEK